MPRKSKPRDVSPSLDDLWIAPRRAPTFAIARTLEPPAGSRTNRYLEFADIALSAIKTDARKKKATSDADQSQHEQNAHKKGVAGKVIAFRNSRHSKRGEGRSHRTH
ncbi:MAG: hypothetical protein JWN42_2009 [Candidatus Angelobacter sp.]|nr:hypothetical protein [Candidatus Angelobacter sp.]